MEHFFIEKFFCTCFYSMLVKQKINNLHRELWPYLYAADSDGTTRATNVVS